MSSERTLSLSVIGRMIGKPGPFQIIECENASAELPGEPPRRRYSCQHYETCLDLAAALNWDNYTCRGCCGEIEESLYWRARQMMKKDSVVRSICGELPDIRMHNSPHEDGTDEPTPVLPQVVGKR